MNDLFIIAPFTIGLIILLGILIGKYVVWTIQLSQIDKLRILHGFFTVRTFRAIREIFWESLLHRNIWKTNPLLGYMHMSFALGWLLLIIVGHIEAYVQASSLSVPPWIPIFFR
ncbi:MAG TPA: (Fe-S)-binding protein, partial [Bacteroidales bacterium]|nr:(Fe-S)-binding protein [Bacteroidales bacterium]